MAGEALDQICFVREVSIRYHGRGLKTRSKITTPTEAVALERRAVQDHAREHFLVLYLDARHAPSARSVISIGTATASLVHPREVFQPAVLLGAVAVIVMHNHPSGDPTLSREDHEVTQRLRKAGDLLGIKLLDHIVWTTDGGFHSSREHEELA